MKLVKKFFEFIDYFHVPISFRYKNDDSYSTFIGGLFTLIFFILVSGFGIYYAIPFCNRKNYSLFYYTINLNKTEEINLEESKASLAFGFECTNIRNSEKYEGTSIEDYLELKDKYIYYINKGENKTTISVGLHTCNISDFNNDINLTKSLNKEKMNKLKCLDNLNHVIKNRYQDKVDNFTYYQIDVDIKNNISALDVKNYLLDNDCKIELYYIDARIEVDDYKEPIKPFLNEVFLQLNPNLNLRMNTYFMNEYFESNDELFFPTKKPQIINNLFSRSEQYFLHREENDEDPNYAKIYIRADTKKMEVRRKYQTVLEFFADTFTFFSDIFIFLEIILTVYNRVSLNYFIGTELFFFKDEENKYFNMTNNKKRIKKLKEKIEGKIGNGTEIFQGYVNNKKDNNKKDNDNNEKENKNINNENIGVVTYNNENNNKNPNNNTNIESNDIINNISTTDKVNNNKHSDEISNTKEFSFLWKEILYAFMKLKELIICKCCRCNKSPKEIIIKKSEAIINSQLDIICFVKRMLSLDVFHDMVNSDKLEIYKFLSMPVISSKEGNKIFQKKEKDQHYSNEDFLLFYKEFKKLIEKENLGEEEIKLIKLVDKRVEKYL